MFFKNFIRRDSGRMAWRPSWAGRELYPGPEPLEGYDVEAGSCHDPEPFPELWEVFERGPYDAAPYLVRLVTPRQGEILLKRASGWTLRACGKDLGLGAGRVRQIEHSALRKLWRHAGQDPRPAPVREFKRCKGKYTWA
jgi:hypothetical protein